MNVNIKSLTFSTKLFIFMTCFTAFFYGMVGNGYILLTISLIPALTKLLACLSKKSSMSGSWLIFIFIMIISTRFSYVPDKAYRFIYMFVLMFLVKWILENQSGWEDYYCKIIYIFTLVNVIAVYACSFFPDMMQSFARIVYSGKGDALEKYTMALKRNISPGLHSDTALSGYFISIFIAYTISNIFDSRKKFLYFFSLAFATIALFSTLKRSFVFANVITCIIFFLINSTFAKRKLNKILTAMTICGVIYLIISRTESIQGIVEKNELLRENSELTNGRTDLWVTTFTVWKKNPIFGVGINSLEYTYGVSSHNVFLQILAETGIVGVLSYIVLLYTSFKKSISVYKTTFVDTSLSQKQKSMYGTAVYVQLLYIIYSFFGNPLYGISFTLPYIMFIALIESYSKHRRCIEDENRNTDISQYP